VSRIAAVLLIVAGIGLSACFEVCAQSPQRNQSSQGADPKALFESGEQALRAGELDRAEQAFLKVLEVQPNVAGAYSNLGVIYMRRKQWSHALTMLKKAERLAPNVPGIQLNIGLAYYRQNEFREAIPAFESVVKKMPDQLQPRYLLGLSYFLVSDWKNAATTLEPIWPQQKENPSFL
jgi:Flp pilus assembly protein TadD